MTIITAKHEDGHEIKLTRNYDDVMRTIDFLVQCGYVYFGLDAA